MEYWLPEQGGKWGWRVVLGLWAWLYGLGQTIKDQVRAAMTWRKLRRMQ